MEVVIMGTLLIKGYLVHTVDIANELRALQYAIDGYIETIGLRDGGVMLVDEEVNWYNVNENQNRPRSVRLDSWEGGFSVIISVIIAPEKLWQQAEMIRYNRKQKA